MRVQKLVLSPLGTDTFATLAYYGVARYKQKYSINKLLRFYTTNHMGIIAS
jgi:hypothetical protein